MLIALVVLGIIGAFILGITTSWLAKGYVEDFMQKQLGTNQTYLRKAVRTGKNLLIDFEKHGHKFDPPSEEELQKKWPDLFNNIRR